MPRDAEPVLQPLKGMDAILVGVVFALLRWHFWIRRWIRRDGREELAKRTVAIMALHALAGLKSTAIAGLLLQECDTEQRVIAVRMRGLLAELPISGTLAHLLHEWIKVRPADASPHLFVTCNGPMHRGTITALMRATGATLGNVRLGEILNRFFFVVLSRTTDKDAYRYYRAATKGLPHPPVALGRLRVMIEGTDPFRDELRRFVDNDVGREFASGEAPMLPPLYDDCIPSEKISQPHPWLPPSHPLVAALSTVEWPQERRARIAMRNSLFAEHGAQIDTLVRTGELPLPQVAALMKVNKAAVTKRRIKARRAADPSRVRKRTGAWLGAVAAAPDERARIDAIAALKWPAGAKAAARFRIVLLKREFGFVDGLIEARKFTVAEASKLFRLYPQKITEMRGDLAAGVFDAGAPKCVKRSERDYWRKIVAEEYAVFPTGDAYVAFWRLLRKKHGFTGGLAFIESVLRKSAPAPVSAGRTAQPTLTAEDAARIALIAGLRWPRGAVAAAEFRRSLLREHFAFVFGLIDRKSIELRQAAELFRVPRGLMTEMRSDYRAGTFEHVLQPPPSKHERRKWLDLVYRELRNKPHSQTPAEFCRRLRVTFGFPLPFASVNQILARQRKKDPEGPARPTEKQGFLRVAMSTTEKARLRLIARADWDRATDHATLRRALVEEHLGFVCALIGDWKLRVIEAAGLFRVSEGRMAQLRRMAAEPVRSAA